MLFLFQHANGQKNVDTIGILKSIIRSESDTTTFLYTDKLDSFFLNKIKYTITKNKICGDKFIRYNKFKKYCFKLSPKEMNYIISEFLKYKQSYWGENLFPNSKLILLDTLDRIKKSLSDTLSVNRIIYSKLLHVRQFTKPVFFHNGKMFLLQTLSWWLGEDLHSVRAISHDLSIYKQQYGVWKRWINIDGGVFDF